MNGTRCKITLEKDPDYYLDARCTVDEHFANKKLRQIVVGVRCAPYKMNQHETVVSCDLASNEEKTIILLNSKKQVCPIIEVSGKVTIEFNGYSRTYSDPDEPFKDLNICLLNGVNTLVAKASGNAATIKFSYREGVL